MTISFLLVACNAPDPLDLPPPVPSAGPIEPGWYSLEPLPVPLQEVSVLPVGEEVWVLGGFDDGLEVADSIWILREESWEAGPALPRPLHHMNAAVVDGVIFIVGAMEGLDFTPVAEVWSLVPGETTWSSHAPLPEPLGAAAVGAVGTDVFVAGGLGSGTISRAYRYDTLTGETAVLPNLPGASDHAVGTGGAAFLLAGGRDDGLANVQDGVVAWSDSGWEPRASLPTARAGAAGCLLPDGRTVVAGGEGNADDPKGVFDQVEIYDPDTDTWASAQAMATPRHGTGAAAWRGGVLIPGGATFQAFRAVDTVEWLVLP